MAAQPKTEERLYPSLESFRTRKGDKVTRKYTQALNSDNLVAQNLKRPKGERLYPSLDSFDSSKQDKATNQPTYTGTYALRLGYIPPDKLPKSKPGFDLPATYKKPSTAFWKKKLWWWFFYLLLATLFYYYYWKPNMEIGFCDEENRERKDLLDYYTRVTCTECPPHAKCSNGKLLGCSEGYSLDKIHPLFQRFYPTSQRCVPDRQQPERIQKLKTAIDKLVAQEAGKLACKSTSGRYEFAEDYIKKLLKPSLVLVPDDWSEAVKQLEREGVGVEIECDDKRKCFFQSMHPEIPLMCRFRKATYNFLRPLILILVITFSSLVSIYFIFGPLVKWIYSFYLKGKREKQENREYAKRIALKLNECLHKSSKENRPFFPMAVEHEIFRHYQQLPTYRFRRIWKVAIEEFKELPNVQERMFGQETGYIFLSGISS
ncbi:hypothetical protein G9A89_006155 [Geosiphon pyriformis]|nr:hypothetical protein G9A89_006155 [Geosiphon pyriformis]